MTFTTTNTDLSFKPKSGNYPRISHNRILPCSFATANNSELGETATAEIRPMGVFDVGQFRYTVQEGR